MFCGSILTTSKRNKDTKCFSFRLGYDNTNRHQTQFNTCDQNIGRDLKKFLITYSSITGTPECGRPAAKRGRKKRKNSNKKIYFFTFFCQFALNNPNFAALWEKFVKKQVFGKKKSFFAKHFPDFFQKHDLSTGGLQVGAGGPQNRHYTTDNLILILSIQFVQ